MPTAHRKPFRSTRLISPLDAWLIELCYDRLVLFTASQDLIVNEVGDLRPKKHRQIIDAVVQILTR